MKKNIRNGCLLVIVGLMCVLGVQAQTDTLNFTDANGLKQGKWVEYVAIDGAKYKTIGYYKDNLKDSVWYSYHSNGNLAYSAYHKRGKIDGIVHYFQEDGTIQTIIVHKEGVFSWMMAFNEQGCPDYEQSAENIKGTYYKNGKWTVPAAPLDTVAGNFTDANGQKQGKWVTMETIFDQKYKTIGYFKDDIGDSVRNSYYSNGNLYQSLYFKNGIPDGVEHFFGADGTINRISVINYGSWIWYMQFDEQGCPIYEENGEDKGIIFYKRGQWWDVIPYPKDK